MNETWLKFCERFKKKVINDAILSDRSAFNYLTRRYTSTVTFSLHFHEEGNSYMNEGTCFILDNEDLNYLYTKYSGKLAEELVLEKQKLDELYNNALITHTPQNASKQE